MAPNKPGPLQALRRKAASQAKLTKKTALAGSGYRNLQRRNAAVTGAYHPENDTQEAVIVRALSKPKPNKVVKTSLKPRIAAPKPDQAPPARPNTEYWLSYGGVSPPETTEEVFPTTTVAVARIAGWRLHSFTDSLKMLLDDIVAYDEIAVTSLNIGGEIVVDVRILFGTEMAAMAAKGGLDGEMLDGRKLRLGYI
ncbi:uncharacterized protein LTR77_010209 [Saxophila tyrrhenica]|uniref:Uncharacterized protein n=1 Tax=Saxophila tyrrhenica TaxID=1690608 RepID=A0AAV9P012_9PEZI|nr:hypothetical protein LTR77_010209 [Saxophila tyrrhenica]